MDLTDKCTELHSTEPGHKIFSLSLHETFFSINPMLYHKASLNKHKNKIISNIISGHNGMKLEIINMGKKL